MPSALMKWPLNDAMVVKSMIGTDLQHRNEREALVVQSGAATENSTFQPGPEETEIFGSYYRIRNPRAHTLFHRQRDCRGVLELNRLKQPFQFIAAGEALTGH